LVFGDYRIVLFALLFQFLMSAIASHLMAERRYQLSLDRAVINRSLRFGWPLLLNGALMFGVFNGERMIVGRELGLETLALFSMALSLTMAPTLMMSKTLSSFFLPQLSATQGDAQFPKLAIAVLQVHLVMGNLMIIGVALLGGPFLHLVLGVKYSGAIPLLTWLAIVQVFRVYKGGASNIAMAAAHTANSMIGNVTRVALLPLAWIIVVQGGDLLSLIWMGICGEMAGFFIGLWMALWRQGLPFRPLVTPLAISAMLIGVAILHAHLQVGWVPNLVTSSGLLLFFAISLLSTHDLRAYVAQRSMHGHTD
jgi:O-antigen/teichoic acid export membrane protein